MAEAGVRIDLSGVRHRWPSWPWRRSKRCQTPLRTARAMW